MNSRSSSMLTVEESSFVLTDGESSSELIVGARLC